MSDSSDADHRKAYTIAGVAALMAGAAWVCWAIVNGVTSGALDAPAGAAGFALPNLANY